MPNSVEASAAELRLANCRSCRGLPFSPKWPFGLRLALKPRTAVGALRHPNDNMSFAGLATAIAADLIELERNPI